MFDLYSFEDILRYGIAIVLVGSIILAIAFSMWGWLLLITSGGKEEKVKPAVNHIRHAIIGLVVLVIILFVAPIFARILGFEYADVIRPASIFDTIKEISWGVFWWTSSSIDDSFDTSSPSIGSDFTDL